MDNSGVGRDAYYTPPLLAERVANAVEGRPETVLDPSVGDGALLRTAERLWPDAKLIGLDIDAKQLRLLHHERRTWSLGRMDMFSASSRAASRLWSSLARNVDVALLNPPFSYRGGASFPATYAGRIYRLSPASAFVAHSLTRLKPNGQLIAVLPAGALQLEKDASFWADVRSQFDVRLVDSFSSTAFRGTRAKSDLVSIGGLSAQNRHDVDAVAPPVVHACVEVIRGRVPVHNLPAADGGERAPFVHTTDLAPAERLHNAVRLAPRGLATKGPLLSVPRVGRLRSEHIRILPQTEVVLSDCVFGLRTETRDELATVQRILLRHIDELGDCYSGPCAPHVTVRRLVDFLGRLGFCSHTTRASADPSFRYHSELPSQSCLLDA